MFKKLSKKSIKSEGPSAPLDVALIGCGPSGMALLHALAYHKSKNPDSCDNLPRITCYERASSAGGLWRTIVDDDPSRSKPENKVVMYDDLYCNIPKELMEYFDYTFQEHFKKPTATFLSRKDILEYLLARNGTDGVLDNVKFNHTVKKVKYDESTGKFKVTVKDDTSNSESAVEYDRCVWASGLNGYLEDPEEVDDVLEEYEGKVMHSSEAYENFGEVVKGKTVMMVGDSYSAEDLTLRALKLGAKKIYICSRSGQGTASETTSWPKGKVEMIWGVPYKVQKKTGFKCQGIYWSEKRQKYRKDDEDPPVKVKDIDVVISCTGYNANLDFVDESIALDEDYTWSAPKGWEMENNALTISLGKVAPSKSLMNGATVYPEIYNGLLISNPKMMYLLESDDAEFNLLEIDVKAWLILGYLMGTIDQPKEKDMTKANDKQLLAEMQIPWLRSGIDRNYLVEIDDLDSNHWSENDDDERCKVLERQVKEFKVKMLARDMKTANYPVDLGKESKLNEKGQKLVDLLLATNKTRSAVKQKSPEGKWWTYRDVLDPSIFSSIHDNTPSVALNSHWMDI